MSVESSIEVPMSRTILWRRFCAIGSHFGSPSRRCIIEMSTHNSKFHVVSLDVAKQ